jgi:hypothetical protein
MYNNALEIWVILFTVYQSVARDNICILFKYIYVYLPIRYRWVNVNWSGIGLYYYSPI